ncbi:Variant surface glycoprotein [Trypanosoma congolense IL3000]|uniref:Variant surface glycoprotein n=1 Tax=Trypanosoma congolense (strain IL3000) TaxID=1068625 RepID=F9W9P2_TRYCI|nr:Variant surface glycoprotein [Trypanosoma congolense IL3000]
MLKLFRKESVIMVCYMSVIAVAVVFGCFVRDVRAQAKGTITEGDNAEQFALLCQIYNVAKNPPIHHVDLEDPIKIVEKIDALNATFAEKTQFNETEPVENSSVAQVKPTATREAAVAQAMIRRIAQKAHTILEEIKKVNATRDIEKVKDEFAQVIFGEGMNESHLCDGALKDVAERGSACGSSGLSSKGKSAGKNLVMDFFCLCSQNTKEGIDNICGFAVGRKGALSEKHGWSEAGLWGSSAMWASIKKGCGRLMQQHTKSITESFDLIGDFLQYLRTGGVFRHDTKDESDRIVGMLGTSVFKKGTGEVKGPVCDGKKGGTKGSPGGMCVYYGQESEWQNIQWIIKLKTSLSMADALNNQTATIQRSIKKLQTLLHRGEEIYETTKVITEIQNPVLPTNLQTTATKRLTAYSGARRYPTNTHFLLLFILL